MADNRKLQAEIRLDQSTIEAQAAKAGELLRKSLDRSIQNIRKDLAGVGSSMASGIAADGKKAAVSFEKTLIGSAMKMGDRIKSFFSPLSKDIAAVMSKDTSKWQKLGFIVGGHFAKSFVTTAGSAMKGLTGTVTGIANTLTSPARLLASPVGMITGGAGLAGVGYAFTKVINAGRDLQSQQISIQKTTNATDAEITQLTQSLIDFANKTGVSREQLMGLAADAGRLGVRGADIEKFAKTFAMAATATNVSTDQAEEVLRTFNAMGESVSNIDRVMSAVNELGNSFPTNERRILDFLGVMPGVKNMLKLTTDQMLALAGVASTTANESGLTGTALLNTSMAFLEAVEGQGKKSAGALKILAETSGMTTEAFSKLVKENGYEALMKFLEGIKRVSAEGGSLVQIFNDMGQDGSRLVRVLSSLSMITGDMRRGAALVGTELVRNTSIQKEFATRTASVEYQQQRVTQVFSNFFATLNDNKVNTRLFQDLADAIAKLFDAHQATLADKWRTIIQKIVVIIETLPQRIALAKEAITSLFTDSGHLNRLMTKIGSLLATALIEGFKAFVNVVWGMAKFIWNPVFTAFKLQLAELWAGMGMQDKATAIATSGLTIDEKINMAGNQIPRTAAQNYFRDKGGGVFTSEYDDKYFEKFVAQMRKDPSLFEKYVIPEMSTDSQIAMRTKTAAYSDSPEIRARMDREMTARGDEILKIVSESIRRSMEKVAAGIDAVWDEGVAGTEESKNKRHDLSDAVNWGPAGNQTPKKQPWWQSEYTPKNIAGVMQNPVGTIAMLDAMFSQYLDRNMSKNLLEGRGNSRDTIAKIKRERDERISAAQPRQQRLLEEARERNAKANKVDVNVKVSIEADKNGVISSTVRDVQYMMGAAMAETL